MHIFPSIFSQLSTTVLPILLKSISDSPVAFLKSVCRAMFTKMAMHPLIPLNRQEWDSEITKTTCICEKPDGSLEKKVALKKRGATEAEKGKGHSSLYFTFPAFQVDQRCLSLCDWFCGVARWPHMAGSLFYEPILPAVLPKGADFLFTLTAYPAALCSKGRKGKL